MDNLKQLIEEFGFCKIISSESPQCIRYVVDITDSKSSIIQKITKTLLEFPTIGSNAYLGNYNDFMEPKKIYKMFRIQLCDDLVLEDDDIEERIKTIKKNISQKNEIKKD